MQASSSLEAENSLLRSELASLNQEMSQVLARAKSAEKGKGKNNSTVQ